MNQDDKRALENQLVVMGLPGLKDPELIQKLADAVNLYPIMSERVEFFCDLLNECEGAKRSEMYNAIKPHLHFPVPSLFDCEARIAAKAERMIRPGKVHEMGQGAGAQLPPRRMVALDCRHCEKHEEFGGDTVADAMGAARKAGWGRGPIRGHEYCAECRLEAMLPNRVAPVYTRRHRDALEA